MLQGCFSGSLDVVADQGLAATASFPSPAPWAFAFSWPELLGVSSRLDERGNVSGISTSGSLSEVSGLLAQGHSPSSYTPFQQICPDPGNCFCCSYPSRPFKIITKIYLIGRAKEKELTSVGSFLKCLHIW